MPYSYVSFLSLAILTSVHFFASKMKSIDQSVHGRFLSLGGGIAIAYVFVDLLPNLSEGDKIVHQFLSGLFPYFERHVYILALCGFLLFFLVDRSKGYLWEKTSFWLSLGSYALFNFFIGYAIAYKNDPSIQPVSLFTFAMALHYFTNDYTLTKNHPTAYKIYGRWILICSLVLGWLTSGWLVISHAAIALVNAFIAGGVIMNVTKHELPAENPNNTATFLFGSAFYTLILLFHERLQR